MQGQVLTEQHVRGTPELVVEISSKGTRKRDETIKRQLYERSGEEYWVVDPTRDVVRVYVRSGDAFDHVVELSREAGDGVTTALLPGLRLPLDQIFRA